MRAFQLAKWQFENYGLVIKTAINATLMGYYNIDDVDFIKEYNVHMSLVLAALSRGWYNINVFGYANEQESAIRIYELSSQYNWDTFYLLLYDFYNEVNSGYIDYGKIEQQLNTAPSCGTHFFANAPSISGWSSFQKFRCTLIEQEGEYNDQGNFNGLDYMLMYNLYHIMRNPVPYVNCNNKLIDDKFPNTYNKNIYFTSNYREDYEVHNTNHNAYFSNPLIITAFETVESAAHVGNVEYIYNHNINIVSNIEMPPPQIVTTYTEEIIENFNMNKNADVSIYAGEKIILKPGFHVKEGSKFHAKIKDYDCESQTFNFTNPSQLVSNYNYSKWNQYVPQYLIETPIPETNLQSVHIQLENEIYKVNVSISPNPVKTAMQVSLSSGIINEIYIYNSLGKLLNSIDVNLQSINIDMSDYSKGVYLIKLVTNTNEVFTEKIIKE